MQGVLMSIIIAYLLPTMIGTGGTTDLSRIVQFIGPIAVAGIVGVVLVILISFIPILGGFVAESSGVQGFIIGVIIFRIFSSDAIANVIERAGLTGVSVYPSFWLSMGYLAIASLLAYAAMLLVAFIQTARGKDSGGLALLLGPAFGVMAGFLPLLMYAQYVGLALRSALNR